jgi:UDP-N-acetylglucosamine acyltransferase
VGLTGMPTSIHPTALIEPGAQLGPDCEIHPYAIVKRWARLGAGVVVHPFAVVGGDPQDLKFDGVSESWVEIGSGTKIRENVTVNRGSMAGGVTRVGENCLLMAGSHVAHDCTVGNRVIIANAVLLAGHVTVGDYAILGGCAAIHQFVRVGEGAMVAGGARITLDPPPFTIVAERDDLAGLNLVGLRRRGVTGPAIVQLKEAFRMVCTPTGNPREQAAAALAGGAFSAPEARRFLEFFAGGQRGFPRRRRDNRAEAEKES